MFDKTAIISWIEDKQLQDGGYCFYKVEPSGGLDTYFAIKTLRLLHTRPKNTQAVMMFWENEEKDGNLSDLHGLFLAVETYKELGQSFKLFMKYQPLLEDYIKKGSHIQKRTFYIC